MYRYDEFDAAVVNSRVKQFRQQVARRLNGTITEDEFKPLRLMNGLYLQLHAYMLRVAIPYGMLSSRQLRMLATIARDYDKGYGHFTTRQNIQYNWIALHDTADVLDDLAKVEMHAIQTSGNCIRNVTADPWAGAAVDEIEDPRIYSEIIRQWSTLHPEFSFLPRKFKIAVSGSLDDRAAVRVHDIGLIIVRENGQLGFQVFVGGGLGRTPYIGTKISDFLAPEHLLSYLEAILRVYNQQGRRDNLYKARIKILVHALGAEKITALVETEWQKIKDTEIHLPKEEVDRIRDYFAPPNFKKLDASPIENCHQSDDNFNHWLEHNVVAHRHHGYAIVNISLKALGHPPGDASADQMDGLADLAKAYSFDEIRVTHEQNLVLPHVEQTKLFTLWKKLKPLGLVTPNIKTISDMICCPGMDYCALATARSIPIAKRIGQHFADLKRQWDIGDLSIKISGCINACGHHHVGHIGILGVDRRGEEFYQITLGGTPGNNAAIGKIIGPAFPSDQILNAIDTIIKTYLEKRHSGEAFLTTWNRIGVEPFKEKLYATN